MTVTVKIQKEIPVIKVIFSHVQQKTATPPYDSPPRGGEGGGGVIPVRVQFGMMVDSHNTIGEQHIETVQRQGHLMSSGIQQFLRFLSVSSRICCCRLDRDQNDGINNQLKFRTETET